MAFATLYSMPRTERRRGRSKRTDPSLFPELDRLKANEEKLRRERIVLLKQELSKARDRVRHLEKELRAVGVSAGELRTRVSWDEVYDQLGNEFTVTELRNLTGASANLTASVLFRWRHQKRIRPVSRGRYRKALTPRLRKL
jgi:hypothetical protein